MKALPCRLGWHDWGLWDVIERGENGLQRVGSEQRIRNGVYLIQERRCESCGLRQLKNVNS